MAAWNDTMKAKSPNRAVKTEASALCTKQVELTDECVAEGEGIYKYSVH